jgi:Transposase DDE domain
VIAAIVHPAVCSRPVALPLLARLVRKDITPAPASRLVLARQMTAALARALPGRDIHVVADGAYAGKELARLPATVTWTTRLRNDAAVYELAPPRTGKRGRPASRAIGGRPWPPSPRRPAFAPVTVHRYGKTATVQAAVIQCLWNGVFGPRPVQVVLIRDRAKTGYDLALAATSPAASPAQVIERYASRWSIEVAIEDDKQIFGAGQARNRLAAAVHRTVPYTLACQSLAMLWCGTAGHHPGDVAGHRARAP